MVTAGTFQKPHSGRSKTSDIRGPVPQARLSTRESKDVEKSVTIAFELSANTMVTLAIFDEDGCLVDVPFEGWLWPGRHQVNCRFKGHSPGRYKCLLDTPTVRLVKYIEVRFV